MTHKEQLSARFRKMMEDLLTPELLGQAGVTAEGFGGQSGATTAEFLGQAGVTAAELDSAAAELPGEDFFSVAWPVGGRVDCSAVLELCRPVMERLGACPSCGWLAGAYHYVRQTMFGANEFSEDIAGCRSALIFYLRVLQGFLDEEKAAVPHDCLKDFDFLSEEEYRRSPGAADYREFLARWRGEYIYEMLRLGEVVTNYHTLGHIAGVHFVALDMARKLFFAGVPVDLTLVSAAAAGHDLGKFGCRPGERVPYLHYYYTDKWFHERCLDDIGHIAANHSVWDVELENLSAESLCLIYADFCVKQKTTPGGGQVTHIFSLKDSYDVILAKLDNVDDKKRRRYRFVFSRLADFESYVQSLARGADSENNAAPDDDSADVFRLVTDDFSLCGELSDTSVRSVDGVLKALSHLGVSHNIRVMHQLFSLRQFGNLLEAARTEKNWRHIRAYLTIFQEYSTYLPFEQKKQTLGFLRELLLHREGDVRRYAAILIGQLIAEYDAGYRKELPESVSARDELSAMRIWDGTINFFTEEDHKLTARQKNRLSCMLKTITASLFDRAAGSDARRFFELMIRHYEQIPEEPFAAFALLDALRSLPVPLAGEEEMVLLADFALRFAKGSDPKLAMAALCFLKDITGTLPEGHRALAAVREAAENFDDSGKSLTRRYLYCRIRQNLNLGRDDRTEALFREGIEAARDIFLTNLKASTSWLVKSVNIEFLVELATRRGEKYLLHTATHFSNMIKVSGNVEVRMAAVQGLMSLVGLLEPDQRNEIAVELLKGLDAGEYEFSKYIPSCLGRFALFLPPEQLDELILGLRRALGHAGEGIAGVALETVGLLLGCSGEYAARFPEEEGELRLRQERLLGLLLYGMANFREEVRQEAMWTISRFFSSSVPGVELKARVAGLSCRRVLSLLGEYLEGRMTLYYRAALLSHLCRFVTNYTLDRGSLPVEEFGRVAFFPGTFDPFTSSHKEIVRAIRDLGCEVYLAVDEFSWSKNTQPHLVRRSIVSMSVADLFHVHLFPDSIPINIANPSDIRRLKEIFADKPLCLVAGEDVISGASAYRAAPGPDTVHSLDHIIIDRNMEGLPARVPEDLIRGSVVRLKLPPDMEDISSTRIRENIDLDRDIAHLTDPAVQEYIYSESLYLNEPRFKRVLRGRRLAEEIVSEPDGGLLNELEAAVLRDRPDAERVLGLIRGSGAELLLLRCANDGRLLGFAAFDQAGSRDLMGKLGSMRLADSLRRQAKSDRMLLVYGVYAVKRGEVSDLPQRLATRVLEEGLRRNCGFAVCVTDDEELLELLKLSGFAQAEPGPGGRKLLTADMHEPLVLLQNVESTFKAPFSENERLQAAAALAHRRLQKAMAALYPGQLVLSLSSKYLLDELAEKVAEANETPADKAGAADGLAADKVSAASKLPGDKQKRVLGECMCVPFGKIMRGLMVPHTVTKTLHTDRIFSEDLSEESIGAFPGYTSLESQVRVIRSFNRPVMLVDDILHHKGRLQTVLPLLENEGVEVRGVLTGVLSDHGRDKLASSGIPVDTVCVVPSLRWWCVESTLYPFIGGDSVRRSVRRSEYFSPGINFIFPYAAPRMQGADPDALYALSETCLENARDIFLVLEDEYRRLNGRSLTVSRINEAVKLPLIPDRGSCFTYDTNLPPSIYLENDLHLLRRLKAAEAATGGADLEV